MLHIVLAPVSNAHSVADASALASSLNMDGAVASIASPFVALEAEGGVVLGAVRDAADATGVVLSAVRSGRWAVGVLLGDEKDPRVIETAVRRARRTSARCALIHHSLPASRAGDHDSSTVVAAAVEATLQLVAVLERRRSTQQQEAGRLIEDGASQREAAERLAVSQQAVHSRLRHGLWQESRTALDAVLPLLQELADGVGAGGEHPGSRQTVVS